MTVADDPDVVQCVRHPRRETSLRCGKCGDPICTRCSIQTPVGARCPACANLRRLPQFDVGLWLVTRASAGGAVVSLGGWLMLSYIPYLRYFLSILVGAAVGEVMSRLAKRRSAMLLDAAVVIAVIGGLLIVEMARTQQGLALFSLIANDPGVLMGIAIPAAIASFVAVVKMR